MLKLITIISNIEILFIIILFAGKIDQNNRNGYNKNFLKPLNILMSTVSTISEAEGQPNSRGRKAL